MNSISVLIIEDNPAEAAALIVVLEEHRYEVTGVAANHKEALRLFYEQKPDIIIIDVFLDGIPEGITFAETIAEIPGASRPFVFLTSSTDRTVFDRARLTRPFSFLMKPFNELEVLYALEMAVEKFYEQRIGLSDGKQDVVVSNEYLFVKKGNVLKKVSISEIRYIEVEERYSTIYTNSGKYVVQMSLTKLTGILDEQRFCRIHRNFIVNLEQVEEIQPSDGQVLVTGNHYLPMSDKYKEFMQRYRVLK